MLKYALLGFLNYYSMTGYELKQIMDTSTQNFWYAKQSQIYTTLKAMEGKGLISSEVEAQDGRPNRRVYTITESGRAALKAWLVQPVLELQAHKNIILLKLFFSSNVDKQVLLTQLRLQRGLHQRQLEYYQNETKDVIQQFAAIIPDTAKDDLLWDATRRFGVMFETMAAQWIDETIAMLEREF